MQYNVAQLLKAPPGTVRDYDVEEDASSLAAELGLTEPIRGHVRLARTNRGILAHAQLDSAVRLECSRCLEPFVLPVRLEFREEYIPEIDVNTGLPVAFPADGYTFRIDESHILDLTEAVRQYALIELPLQPLCSVTCRGLCPECGQNLNLAACGCAPPVVDPRLAKLAALLDESEKPASPPDEANAAPSRRQRRRS